MEVGEHVILFMSYCAILFEGKMLDNVFYPASIHANKAVFDLICERQGGKRCRERERGEKRDPR